MKVAFFAVLLVIITTALYSVPSVTTYEAPVVVEAEVATSTLQSSVKEFLESKGSPLAPETELLLEQKHWKLLIAISAIESQYCKRQLGYNCWGIGGDSAYRHYESYADAIVDADALIEHWQIKGRWLTVEDMNCHYVVPCNDNWVRVVNKVLADLEQL